jgi:hypothetical protein
MGWRTSGGWMPADPFDAGPQPAGIWVQRPLAARPGKRRCGHLSAIRFRRRHIRSNVAAFEPSRRGHDPVWHNFRPLADEPALHRRPHLTLSLSRAVVVLGLLASVAGAQTPPPVGQAVPLAAQTPPVVSAKPLVVLDAWVRATPGADIAAAYMTLRNAGAVSITVTGVESPIAGHAMIHETKVESGQ